MKIILTTLSAVVFTTIAFAQNPDKALAKVSYNFVHIQDTTQKDKPYTENMLLVIGKNASVYTSYDKIMKQMDLQKQFIEQMKNQPENGPKKFSINNSTPGKSTSLLDYFSFAKENKFYTKERLLTNYLIEEPLAKIDWKITKDTLSFSGIHCQKATAHFKGRNWIAWYAPELPFQSGPWKLNGLPGLIIEAYDDKKEVIFQFTGMENITAQAPKKAVENNEPKIITSGGSINIANFSGLESTNPYEYEIKLPADAIKTTKKELDKLKEARDKDPQGFMKTQMGATGASIRVEGMRISPSSSSAPKIVLNNPIELPEKK